MTDKTLDILAFRTAIREAARRAFTALRQRHPEERFYAFALYTTPEASYVVPTANSEEGLQRAAERYVGKGYGDLQENLHGLRFSPCDWEYHCAGERHFDEAQRILDAAPSSDDLDDDAWEKQVALRMKTFVQALKDLDRDGFFGKGRARRQVVLLVMMGDQDERLLLDAARKLNPPSVYEEVFNIGGNKYRLVTRILYASQKVFVLKVMTHSEYDEGKWKEECGCFEPPPKKTATKKTKRKPPKRDRHADRRAGGPEHSGRAEPGAPREQTG